MNIDKFENENLTDDEIYEGVTKSHIEIKEILNLCKSRYGYLTLMNLLTSWSIRNGRTKESLLEDISELWDEYYED